MHSLAANALQRHNDETANMLYMMCVIVGQALQVATPNTRFFCKTIAGLVVCICFLAGHAHLLLVRNGLCLPLARNASLHIQMQPARHRKDSLSPVID